jgi:predicted nucleotidyltransferase
MVEPAIVSVVQSYLAAVSTRGLAVRQAVLFGSHARGDAHPDSDVDILVIAPEFDEPYDKSRVDLLWELRAQTDSRIEPIAVGERQWREDDASALIEMARREGQVIPLLSGRNADPEPGDE